MNMESAYAKSNIKQTFLSILPAQIFSFVTSSLSGIVNGLVIGNYLTNLDMIALGFVSPVVQVLSVSSTVVSAGSRIICGRYIGRGEKEKINYAFTTAVNILLIVGIVLTIVGITFAGPIANVISNADAYSRTVDYIRGLSIGIIPTILVPCLMTFLQMKNEGTYALISTAFLAASNLILDLLLINEYEASIFGVGLVTSISQYLTLAFIVLKFINCEELPHLKRGGERFYKETIIIGVPSAMANLLYGLRNSTLIKIGSIYGNEVVNAISILNSSCGPIDALNIGTGQACLMLASVYIGEKDKKSLTTLVKVSIYYGCILALIKVGLIFGFGDKIALAYNATGLAKEYTIQLYRAYSYTMPLNIITCCIMNTYQSFGKITYCNILMLLTAFIMPISFVYTAKNLIGVNSIWYCYVEAEILILIVIYAYACFKKKRVIKNLEDILVLDEQIEVGNHISITVKTTEEVVEVAKQVQEYCLKENIDRKKSMITGLCCEEMAANIVEHGFTKSNKKDKQIDIFVDVENENVHIRIKDNSVAFDPHIKIDDSNPEVNIGIKMVSKLAKEMNYQNAFGLNVLSIIL